jgi:hypothetical protein
VGVKVGHHAVPHAMGAGGSERKGLMVTFTAVGTAIHQHGDAPAYPPETTLDLTD